MKTRTCDEVFLASNMLNMKSEEEMHIRSPSMHLNMGASNEEDFHLKQKLMNFPVSPYLVPRKYDTSVNSDDREVDRSLSPRLGSSINGFWSSSSLGSGKVEAGGVMSVKPTGKVLSNGLQMGVFSGGNSSASTLSETASFANYLPHKNGDTRRHSQEPISDGTSVTNPSNVPVLNNRGLSEGEGSSEPISEDALHSSYTDIDRPFLKSQNDCGSCDNLGSISDGGDAACVWEESVPALAPGDIPKDSHQVPVCDEKPMLEACDESDITSCTDSLVLSMNENDFCRLKFESSLPPASSDAENAATSTGISLAENDTLVKLKADSDLAVTESGMILFASSTGQDQSNNAAHLQKDFHCQFSLVKEFPVQESHTDANLPPPLQDSEAATTEHEERLNAFGAPSFVEYTFTSHSEPTAVTTQKLQIDPTNEASNSHTVVSPELTSQLDSQTDTEEVRISSVPPDDTHTASPPFKYNTASKLPNGSACVVNEAAASTVRLLNDNIISGTTGVGAPPFSADHLSNCKDPPYPQAGGSRTSPPHPPAGGKFIISSVIKRLLLALRDTYDLCSSIYANFGTSFILATNSFRFHWGEILQCKNHKELLCYQNIFEPAIHQYPNMLAIHPDMLFQIVYKLETIRAKRLGVISDFDVSSTSPSFAPSSPVICPVMGGAFDLSPTLVVAGGGVLTGEDRGGSAGEFGSVRGVNGYDVGGSNKVASGGSGGAKSFIRHGVSSYRDHENFGVDSSAQAAGVYKLGGAGEEGFYNFENRGGSSGLLSVDWVNRWDFLQNSHIEGFTGMGSLGLMEGVDKDDYKNGAATLPAGNAALHSGSLQRTAKVQPWRRRKKRSRGSMRTKGGEEAGGGAEFDDIEEKVVVGDASLGPSPQSCGAKARRTVVSSNVCVYHRKSDEDGESMRLEDMPAPPLNTIPGRVRLCGEGKWRDGQLDDSWAFAFPLIHKIRCLAMKNINIRWARERTAVGGSWVVGKGRGYCWRCSPKDPTPDAVRDTFLRALIERNKSFGPLKDIDNTPIDALAMASAPLGEALQLDAEGLKKAADSMLEIHRSKISRDPCVHIEWDFMKCSFVVRLKNPWVDHNIGKGIGGGGDDYPKEASQWITKYFRPMYSDALGVIEALDVLKEWVDKVNRRSIDGLDDSFLSDLEKGLGDEKGGKDMEEVFADSSGISEDSGGGGAAGGEVITNDLSVLASSGVSLVLDKDVAMDEDLAATALTSVGGE